MDGDLENPEDPHDSDETEHLPRPADHQGVLDHHIASLQYLRIAGNISSEQFILLK